MKERIRDRLKMIENHLDSFNDNALQFMDIDKIMNRLSEWRWFISHDYFKKGCPKPTGYNSNPPLGFLYSHLQGQSVPLARDIGTCIEPVVQSGLMTEHAARRIMNRLEMLYGYVSAEDILRSQQDHRDREDKKTKDRLRAAKARVDRKAERKEFQQEFIEKYGPSLGEKYQEQKAIDKESYRLELEARKKEVTRRARERFTKMKEEQKERRK